MLITSIHIDLHLTEVYFEKLGVGLSLSSYEFHYQFKIEQYKIQ